MADLRIRRAGGVGDVPRRSTSVRDVRLVAETTESFEEGVTVLTVENLARRWAVNVKTLYSEIHNGTLPAIRLGRVFRVSLQVVRSIESQGCVVPTGGSDGSTTQ
jgi:excisionase family DNA binding protein